MTLREDFMAFDDRLSRAGVPPLTAWWRDGIGRWLDAYEAKGVLELWACVGRGAAKSTAIYKLALFFTLFGDFVVPPGERHYAVVLSRLKEEASKGIAIISRWLRILEIEHRFAGDVIDLVDLPRGIRVVAASVGSTSGWRAFFVGRDERSKWPQSTIEDSDAEEIDTSAAAMTATHPNAPHVAGGSAWGAFGAFFDAITGGTTERRVVLGPAPTWVAAPHVSQESTRRKEANERKWRREYLCEFQGSSLAAFTPEWIEEAFRPPPYAIEPVGGFRAIIDASSGRKDAWTFCLAFWAQRIINEEDAYVWETYVDAYGKTQRACKRDKNGALLINPDWKSRAEAPIFCLRFIDGFEGAFASRLSADDVVDHVAANALSWGAPLVIGDQREAYLLESAFVRRGLRFVSIAYTNTNKAQAVAWLSRLLQEGRLKIETHAKMKEELLGFQEKILPSGLISYEGKETDDFACLAVTSALADINGYFSHSPTQTPSRCNESGPGDFESSI